MKHLKNHSFYCIILLGILVVLLPASSLVYAQRTVGVQVGDWAEYTIAFTTEGNFTIFEDPFGFENITSIRVTVVEIADTNVTQEANTYFANGSDTVQTGWIDIETGDSGGEATFPLIAENLVEGDRIYTNNETMFSEYTINETLTRPYLGSTVEVNRWNMNVTTPPNPFLNSSIVFDIYWYRDSGFPAEITMFMMMETMGNKTSIDMSVNIISIIPEFQSILILPMLIVSTLVAVVLSRRRNYFEKAGAA
ncbi:MAG: hypothetical protein JSV57_02750 [Candidatus Bathyarchaeota archaeon]|nr:MAG: hypothetical protein JSV57_02750 [Candidatus Bathyarchaeota archaeon]